MGSPGFCGVCRTNVRGSYATHAGTTRHRSAIVRGEKGRGNRMVPRAAAIRRQNAGRTLRVNVDRYLDAITARVRKHRRSRPNDGTARVVVVTPHYRRKPTPSHRTHKLHRVAGVWMVFGFDAAGRSTSMRRATRREAAEGATL